MNKLALVIGNANYSFDPLPNAGNDALLVAQALVQRGFTVTQVRDADAYQIDESVKAFTLDVIEQNALALFYFAGHAIELNGAAYLLGTGMSGDFGPGAVLHGAFALSEFFRLSADIKSPRVVVLDACRETVSHWKSDDWRLFAENISDQRQEGVNRHDNTLIAYSTSSGDIAADGLGNNSLYTLELCQQIFRHGVTVEDSFKDLGTAIIQQSEQKQRPWFYSSLNSQVSFSDLPTYRKLHSFHVPIIPLEGGLFFTPDFEVKVFSSTGNVFHLNASGFGLSHFPSQIASCCVSTKHEFIVVSPKGNVNIGNHVFHSHEATSYGVVVSPSGDSIIVFGDSTFLIFRRETDTWTKVFEYVDKKNKLWMCALFVSDDVALIGSQMSQLVWIENVTGAPKICPLDMKHFGDVYSLISLSQDEVLCTFSDGEVRVVSPSSSVPLRWAGLGRFVKTSSSRRSSLLNSVNDDETVHRLIFKPETHTEEDIEFLRSRFESNHLLFSALSSLHPLLAVGSGEGLIYLIDTRTAVTVQIIDHGVGRASSLDGLAFANNGNLVVLGQKTISYYAPVFDHGIKDGLLPDL